MFEKEVSVIIAQGRKEIISCINSLENQRFDRNLFEIIIVRDDSIQQQFNNSFIKTFTINTKSTTIKRNLGVEKSKGRIINFVDDDEILPEDYLEKAVHLFKKESFDILGGPNIGLKNQSFQEYLSDILLKYSLGNGVRRKFNLKNGTKVVCSKDFSTCNLFLLNKTFTNLGGFNKNLAYGGEDTEFLYRAEKARMKFFFEPSLITLHQRRSFPLQHVKQLFIWGKNNGKLLLLYPSLIFRTDFFYPPIILLFIMILFFILNIKTYIFLVVLGYFLIFLVTLIEGKNFKDAFFFTICFPLHYLSYTLGLIFTYVRLPWLIKKFKKV